MKISFLNHASLMITTDDAALLFDPWFSGTAFAGGWGLQYHNPDALEKAKECTHLWISHSHPDHLHIPTLKQLVNVRPDLIALANRSANFQMEEALQGAGLKNIVRLYERRKVTLAININITRFPTAGIDNMLLIETPKCRILNYNDCHLPMSALLLLLRKIGKVDILLNNFNHAIKFIEHPRRSDDEIRKETKSNYMKVIEAINPSWVIPFASAHYYRAPYTFWQNSSLLELEELAEIDPRIIPLKIGREVVFDEYLNPRLLPRVSGITLNSKDVQRPGESVEVDVVLRAAKHFGKLVGQAFPGLTFWIPELRIRLEESHRVLVFDVHNRIFEEDMSENKEAHIEAHSSALWQWFSKINGSDSFFIGGHFDVLSETTKPIRRIRLACSLMEKRLGPRSLARYMTSFSGIKFLLNRREEILVTLIQGRLRVGNRVS